MMIPGKRPALLLLALVIPVLLLLFSESSSGDGIDGILGNSSSGVIGLSLQILDSGALVINPGTPAAMTPEFVIQRLGQTLNRQGRADFALCIIGGDSRQYQIDTVLLGDNGVLQQAPEGIQTPYFISIGSAINKVNSVRLRTVSKTQCNNRNALRIFVTQEEAARRNTDSLHDKFKLLLKAE